MAQQSGKPSDEGYRDHLDLSAYYSPPSVEPAGDWFHLDFSEPYGKDYWDLDFSTYYNPDSADPRHIRPLTDYRLVVSKDDQAFNEPFTRRALLAEVQDMTGAHDGGVPVFPAFQMRREIVVEEHPVIHVSRDGTVAVPETGREFFATPELIEVSNRRLKLLGSKLTLLVDATTHIEFDDSEGTRRLVRVIPNIKDPIDFSRDFARQVMGGHHTHAVLRPKAEEGRQPGQSTVVRIKTDMEISGVSHLAEALVPDPAKPAAQASLDPESIRVIMEEARGSEPAKWPAP
ncbi:hypothetical protein ACWD7F_39865, partial [Streptomyces sp. NPDC005122]